MTDPTRTAAGPVSAPPRGGRTAPAWALAGVGVLLQVAYPLLDDRPLRAVTVASVVCFAAAAVLHAGLTRGPRWAAGLLLVAGGTGFAVEALGVATGVPFGTYGYESTLGWKLLGVPVLVPLAWLMLAYPCLLAGRRLAGGRRWTAWALGAWTLAAWDLFLDPQMVAAGHWSWAFPEPGLPGIPGVPLTNYAGWLVTATVMMLLLDRLPRSPGDGRLPGDAVPAAVLLWTYASQLLANLAFFGRPAVALWGGLAMGLTVVPYALALRRDRLPTGAGTPAEA
ncbi:MAG TPA: carotenoid biosynthesis protein [Jiangellales bacterium]|nr:carotenoid biosynthesis protein [Jiangellales bacterium]